MIETSFADLSYEENSLGRFLKEYGKADKTRAGKMMVAVGKTMGYSGQQRLSIRVPLVRLYQVGARNPIMTSGRIYRFAHVLSFGYLHMFFLLDVHACIDTVCSIKTTFLTHYGHWKDFYII